MCKFKSGRNHEARVRKNRIPRRMLKSLNSAHPYRDYRLTILLMARLTFPLTHGGLINNPFSLKEIDPIHKHGLVLVNFT